MQLILKKKNMQTSDRTFNIDEGSTITENYNETLDSAVIRVSHISEPIDIEPFDKAILHDEQGRLSDRYMCVDTYTEIMESLDPVLYTYEINLFSETKELENVALPNLAITQLASGTHRTVLYYINRYLGLYGPKLRISGGWLAKYNLKSSLNSKFTIDCPEMQWNNPTLREVLTDLMMVADCIPVLRNNVIDCIDLTEVKNPINKSKVNYIQRSQSSEDYVSELKMDMQNVMQTQVDNVKQTCTRVEYTTLTTDGVVLKEDNCYVKTQFPILKINHFWIIYQMGVEKQEVYRKRMFKIDLCNINGYRLLYEKTEYDTLAVDRLTTSLPAGAGIAYLSSRQNYCVYYTRGDNKIDGFSTERQAEDFFKITVFTMNVLKHYLATMCPDVGGNTWTASITEPIQTGNSYFSTLFEIEYETTTDSVFTAGKYIPPTHQRVIIDNQTNSYVDAYNQGFMEYQKVNRLGNHQLYINARFESGNPIKIGDYYDDNIVYQTQYQIYHDHIEVNATATKNYILRDYFTGVKARVRSWKIANGSEALTRHELDKYYLELSFSRKNEEVDVYYDVAYYFLTPIYTGNIWPINKVAVKVDNSRPLGSEYYCLDLIGRIMGNSIVYNFGFDDNFQTGKRVSDDVDESKILNSELSNVGLIYSYRPFRVEAENWSDSYGGIVLEPLRYVDNNGECNYVTYIFSYQELQLVHANLSNDEEKTLMLTGCRRPIINYGEFSSGVVFQKYQKEVYKDNREIIKVSTQFELCSDTYDIAFTKKFLEMQQCIRNSNEMYYLNNTHYEEEASLDTSGGDFMTTITVNENIDRITNLGQRIEYSGVGITITLSNIYKTAISDTETKIDAYYSVSGDLQNLESFQGYISYNITFRQLVLRLRQGDISGFNYKNMSISNTTVIGMNADINVSLINNLVAYIDLPNVTDTNHAFYITFVDADNNEQILIGWTGHSRVYLNVLLSRDYNIYDNNGNIIGSI